MNMSDGERDCALDNEVREYAETSWEDFRDILEDPAHERHGIQLHIANVYVKGAELAVILDDGSIHHYVVSVRRLQP